MKNLKRGLASVLVMAICMGMLPVTALAASSSQIVFGGGAQYYDALGNAVTKDSENHFVTVSKTISGTEKENEFDITLSVDTKEQTENKQVVKDSAVVLSVDLSSTMTKSMGNSTRIKVAIEKAKAFITSYGEAGQAAGAHRYIAVVGFNRSGEVFTEWTDVSNETKRQSVLTAVGNWASLISSKSKWETNELGGQTNIEAGLLLSYDLLAQQTSVDYRYCILLSDGAPTVHVDLTRTEKNVPGQYYYGCLVHKCDAFGTVGTSCETYKSGVNGSGVYTNPADYQRASAAANKIKALNNTQLYTIALAGSSWLDDTKTFLKSASTSDYNTGLTARTWLTSISSGSGYMIAGDDAAGVTNAFEAINNDIKTATIPEKTWAKAVNVSDPLPDNIALVGTLPAGASLSNDIITWNINAGKAGSYTMTYRVRLMNEAAGFKAGQAYETNGTTVLTYKMVNDNVVDDNAKNVQFLVPQVKGYTGALTFSKIDKYSAAKLDGAEFTLTHNCDCGVSISAKTACSQNGKVTFSAIPSGHTYTLKETKTPSGAYLANNKTSTVAVYDGQVTVTGALLNTANWTVTNELDPKETSFAVTKAWQNGAKPAAATEITVKVYRADGTGKATGSAVDTLKLSAANQWTDETVMLPTVDVTTGAAINYTVEEVIPSGAQYIWLKTEGNIRSGFVITNLLNAEMELDITKKWVAPSSARKTVQIQILCNGEAYGAPIELTRANGWKKTVEVPVYDEYGVKNTYSVEEVGASNGSVSIDGTNFVVSVKGFEVTNTIKQETISVGGTKTWNVKSWDGASAPEAVIELLRDGEPYRELTVTPEDASYCFEGLDKYAVDGDGHEYTYKVRESYAGGGDIVSSQSGNNFTNTLEDIISVHGTKTWVDEGEETRPDTIKINLLRNGDPFRSITLRAKTVVEQGAPIYGPETYEAVLDPETGEPVLDAETGEPMVNVIPGEIVGYEETVLAPELTFAFEGLDEYDAQGKRYVYTVTEDDVEYYSCTVNGYSLTNTLNGDTKTVQVSKVWNDAGANHSDDTVYVGVYREKDDVKVAELALTADSWKDTVSVTKWEDGSELDYYVRELTGENGEILEENNISGSYRVNYTQTGDVWNITNTICQDYTDVTVHKAWVGGSAAYRPVLTFTLKESGSVYADCEPQTYRSGDEGVDLENLTVTFEDLPVYKYDRNGNASLCVYTVEETMSGDEALVARYTTTGSTGNGGTITNTFRAETTSVSGQKIWVAGGYEPEVTVELYADGEYVTEQTTSNKRYSFNALPAFNVDGSAIEYTVKEKGVNDGVYTDANGSYNASVGEDGTTLYNVIRQDDASVYVSKVWSGPVPDACVTFTVTRSAQGQVDDSYSQTITLPTEDGTWEYTLENQEKYDLETGYEWVYSVSEDGVVDGVIELDGKRYTSEKRTNNTFVNTIIIPMNGEVTVTKIWQDSPGGVAAQPADVAVQLLANGVPYGENVTLGGENLSHTFDNLPVYTSDTYSRIVYTVQEIGEQDGIVTLYDGAQRYDVDYAGQGSEEQTITNTLKDEYYYRIWRYYEENINGRVRSYTDHDEEYTSAVQGEVVNINAADWTNCSTDASDSRVYTFRSAQTDVTLNSAEHSFVEDDGMVSFSMESSGENRNYYDVHLYYRYKKTVKVPEVPQPENKDLVLTVEWIDTEGSALREVERQNKEAGAEYTTEQHTFEGYVFLETTGDAVSGVMDADKHVVYIYEKQAPVVEIPEEEIPEEEYVEIFDEEIPLAEVPETGDSMFLWLAASAMSGLGMIGVNLGGKKRKEEEN